MKTILYGIIELWEREDSYRPFSSGGTFRLRIHSTDLAVIHLLNHTDFACGKWFEIKPLNTRIKFEEKPTFGLIYERKLILSTYKDDGSPVRLHIKEGSRLIVASAQGDTYLLDLARLLVSGIPEFKTHVFS